MTTTREAILQALKALLATDADGFFPVAVIDEPEPSLWDDLVPTDGVLLSHAAAVQDGPPPSVLAIVSGAEGEDLYELELEAVIAYAVQGRPMADIGIDDVGSARRARRDQASPRIAALIAADRTLGLEGEVYAEVLPAARDDAVAFRNAAPAATSVTPIRILYTAAHAAG